MERYGSTKGRRLFNTICFTFYGYIVCGMQYNLYGPLFSSGKWSARWCGIHFVNGKRGV